MTIPTDREEGFVEDQRKITIRGVTGSDLEAFTAKLEQLNRQDALLAEAAEVLRAFVEEEPLGVGGAAEESYCTYCEGRELGSPTWQFEHTKECSWVRAKPLLDKLGERE